MPEPNVDDNLNQTQRPGLQTRASNATKHPGKAVTDLVIHRRSHSEVVAARQAAEEAKAAEAEEQLIRIKAIALIRHKLGQEMEMKVKERRSRRLNGEDSRDPVATAGSRNEVSVPVETNVKSKRGKSKTKATETVARTKNTRKPRSTTKNSTGRGKKGRSKKESAAAQPAPMPSSPLSEYEDLIEELPHVVPVKVATQTKAVGVSAKRKRNETPSQVDDTNNPFQADDQGSESDVSKAERQSSIIPDEVIAPDEIDPENVEDEALTPMDVDRDHDCDASPGMKRPNRKKRKQISSIDILKQEVHLLKTRTPDKEEDSSGDITVIANAEKKAFRTRSTSNLKSTATRNDLEMNGNRRDTVKPQPRSKNSENSKAQGEKEAVRRKPGSGKDIEPQPKGLREAPEPGAEERSDNVRTMPAPSKRREDSRKGRGSEVQTAVTTATRNTSVAPSESVSQKDDSMRGRSVTVTPLRPIAKSRNGNKKVVKTPHPDETLEPRTPAYTRGSPMFNQARHIAAGVVIDNSDSEDTSTGKNASNTSGAPPLPGKSKSTHPHARADDKRSKMASTNTTSSNHVDIVIDPVSASDSDDAPSHIVKKAVSHQQRTMKSVRMFLFWYSRCNETNYP
ncbi:hypothetical protein SCHPADRAFT_947634 [Schizopora paradoxa]|uniref:Uncharacterized protein n=1 Tax=Schizopora paradoxa TaxID=27342 RepID=A0A0H2R4Z6_9AGAM|nr:hypothetical protein SCHPADRAFT_947634 [Schizopora paradoxa]